jgi:hypothetical protein
MHEEKMIGLGLHGLEVLMVQVELDRHLWVDLVDLDLQPRQVLIVVATALVIEEVRPLDLLELVL